MTDERAELVMELATVAARRTYRNFGKFASFDDLRAAALEYAVRKEDLVDKFLDREDEKERRRGEGALIRVLQRAAERYARKEKAHVLGYKVEDEYFYAVATVEAMIRLWDSGDLDGINQVFDPAEMGGRRKTKPASEGNDLLAMVADVDRAMKSLDPRTYGIVRSRVVDETPVAKVGEAWEISPQRVSQIYATGIRKVIEALGGERP